MINKISGINSLSFRAGKTNNQTRQYYRLQNQSDCVEFTTNTQKRIAESCQLEKDLAHNSKTILSSANVELMKSSALSTFLQSTGIETISIGRQRVVYDKEAGSIDELDGDKLVKRTLLRSKTNEIGYILKGYTEDKDEVLASQVYGFENGKLNLFVKGYAGDVSSREFSKEIYAFKDGKLDKVALGVTSSQDCSLSVERAAILDDGHIQKYIKNYVQSSNGDESGVKFVRAAEYEFNKVVYS